MPVELNATRGPVASGTAPDLLGGLGSWCALIGFYHLGCLTSITRRLKFEGFAATTTPKIGQMGRHIMVDEGKLHQFIGQMLGDLGGAASISMVRIGDLDTALSRAAQQGQHDL